MPLPNYTQAPSENSGPWQNPFQAYSNQPSGGAPAGGPTPAPGWTFNRATGGWGNPAQASHDPNNPTGIWAPLPGSLNNIGNTLLGANGQPLPSMTPGPTGSQLADIQTLMAQIQQQRQSTPTTPGTGSSTAPAGTGSPFGNPAYRRQMPTGVNHTQELFYAPAKAATSPANPSAKGAPLFNPQTPAAKPYHPWWRW